jgi:hypothetical protein
MTKAHGVSGGGIASNKNVNVGVRAGSRSTNAVSTAVLDHQGRRVVNIDRLPPLETPVKAAVPLGNEVALNVKGGGPGVGRTVMKTGSQGCHD